MNRNHWNALTDGQMKFIFFAQTREEQLFNLTADPEETRDLSAVGHMAETLQLWRSRMVEQFKQEGRGGKWVQDGKLVKRRPCNYGPHFPMEVKNCKVVRPQ